MSTHNYTPEEIGEATLAIAREKAHNGADRLDQTQADWYDIIDLPSLDMSNAMTCVIGQLARSYATLDTYSFFAMCKEIAKIPQSDDSWEAEMAAEDEMDRLGFRAQSWVMYGALDVAWREEITARKAST